MKATLKYNTEKYVGMAVFSALAFVVTFFCSVIPNVAGFLSIDAKDAVIAIASFVYGPVSAVIISFIAAFIEFITISTTGWYGFVMNFVSSAVFSLTASLIYKRFRNINGAMISFLFAIIATTAVMLLMNIFVTPLYLVAYFGMPKEVASSEVINMLPKILLPFNFAKSLLNSAIAMLFYKPVSMAMRRAGLAKGEAKISFNRSSALILAVGSVILVCAIILLVMIK